MATTDHCSSIGHPCTPRWSWYSGVPEISGGTFRRSQRLAAKLQVSHHYDSGRWEWSSDYESEHRIRTRELLVHPSFLLQPRSSTPVREDRGEVFSGGIQGVTLGLCVSGSWSDKITASLCQNYCAWGPDTDIQLTLFQPTLFPSVKIHSKQNNVVPWCINCFTSFHLKNFHWPTFFESLTSWITLLHFLLYWQLENWPRPAAIVSWVLPISLWMCRPRPNLHQQNYQETCACFMHSCEIRWNCPKFDIKLQALTIYSSRYKTEFLPDRIIHRKIYIYKTFKFVHIIIA